VRILHGWQPGAVCLAGTTRLRVLEPLARYATGLAAFGDPDAREPSPVAWVLGLSGGRVTLTLSPDPTRGFSGEGGLLLDLVSDRARLDAVEVEHAVASRTRFSLERVEADASLPRERAIPALSWLGVHGHVGFDVAEGAFFWRHLPYPDEVLATAPPRLRDATALAAAGAVESVDDGEWRVRSGDSEYRAALDGDKFLCTCPWVARNGTSRGPCKHVLAGAIARARASDRVQVSADPP
jgi:hypothetical protein